MSERPRKGRPVAFAPITPERPQPDPVFGLKFTIEARHGGTVLVDMTALDPRPLAIAFAGALRRAVANPLLRQAAGLTIVVFGLYVCMTALDPPLHRGGAARHGQTQEAAPGARPI